MTELTGEKMAYYRRMAAFADTPVYREAIEWLEHYWRLYLCNNGQGECALLWSIKANDGSKESIIAS